MSWLRQRLGASLRKTCLAIAVVACAIGAFSTDDAWAQPAVVNVTCAQIDPSRGGTPISNLQLAEVNLTVAVGDRIRIVNPNFGAPADFIPPGGVLTSLPSPAVITVGPGQAGVWNIFSGQDVSCTVAPTPTEKSETTDGMLSTFLRVDGSILDLVIIPGTLVTIPEPAGDEPLKFAPRVPTDDPFYDGLGRGVEPQGLAALGVDTSSKGFGFSVDLRSLVTKAKVKDGSAYDGLKDGDAGYSSPWNAWVSGRYVDFDDDNTNADRDGHLWWVASGLSYQIGQSTTIGAFSRVRNGEVDSVALNSQLDSDFFGGGVYFATRFLGGLGLAGAVLYEGGDNDISIEGATGSFDTDQWTVEGRIDKRFTWGRHWIEPAVNVLYTTVERDGYTDSLGAVVPSSELELGRLTYGPKIGTTIEGWRSAIRPFMRVRGIWDFVNDGDYLLVGGTVISNADTALNLGGGVEVDFLNGAIVTVVGDWFDYGDDLDGWSISGALGMPLAALGFGSLAPAGQFSLGLAASAEDQSARAKFVIPLN